MIIYEFKIIDKHKPIATFAQSYSTQALNMLVKNMELDCKQYNWYFNSQIIASFGKWRPKKKKKKKKFWNF